MALIPTGPRGPIGRTGPAGILTDTTSTLITGLLKGNGATVSAATAGVDYILDTNYFRLTANGTGITTIADFFGTNSAIPTVLNAVYEIEWHCYFTITTGASTMTWTIVNTQTVTNMVANWFATPVANFATQGTVTAAGVKGQTAASVALPASAALTAGDHYHVVHALIECATAGNVRLRATEAGTATPLRDSWFRVRRLPAGNIGTFAA